MPLVNERINKLAEAPDMLGFLFVEEDEFGRDADDVAKVLDDDGLAVVRASAEALEALRHLDHRGDRGGAAGRSSSTSWASSRATRSARSGSRSPAAGSRRRSSSPWSCSAGSAACPGSQSALA